MPQAGIQFGTYHSICDWRHPDYPTDSPGGAEKPNPTWTATSST